MTLAEALERVLADYPAELRERQRRHVPRHVFHVELLTRAIGNRGTVVDLGGAASVFLPLCVELGLKGILIEQGFAEDDPRADVQRELWRRVHEPRGIEVHRRDVIAQGVALPEGSVDAVGCFGVLEHFHHSPRTMLRSCVAALRPGGVLLVGTPNCVNLRKRLTVPLGRGAWSRFEDWYEPASFRGHVREPELRDLVRIARDLGLAPEGRWGRNWMGYLSPRSGVRLATRVGDRLLRHFPTLCADIYVLGRKPGGPQEI